MSTVDGLTTGYLLASGRLLWIANILLFEDVDS